MNTHRDEHEIAAVVEARQTSGVGLRDWALTLVAFAMIVCIALI